MVLASLPDLPVGKKGKFVTHARLYEMFCAVCGGVVRGDPNEPVIILLNSDNVPIWIIHQGSCVRDFFAAQRRRLAPMLTKMSAHDPTIWGRLRTRIGVAAWFDPATENPHRFVNAVQDALLALGTTPMGEACRAAGVSKETFFSWYEDLEAVLLAFNMMPKAPVSDPVGPQLRLISSTPPSA